MTTDSSLSASPPGDRRRARRESTIAEALDLAEQIVAEDGVGALTVVELARRMGMRGPSFYNYFPSLHAVYDALFARGLQAQNAAIEEATDGCDPGVDWLSAMARSIVRWSVENPGLAALQYWRPIPGFEPSAQTFAASKQRHERVRAQLAVAARSGQLSRRAASEEAIGLFTVVITGLFTQQAANQPGVPYESGRFTALTDRALDMFFHQYRAQGRQ